MKKVFLSVWNALSNVVASIKWPGLYALFNHGLYYNLTESDHDRIRDLMKDNYLVALTRRKCHLTTYIIGVLSWIVTHEVQHYTHSFMNVEGDLDGHLGMKFIEATEVGVHYSTFMQVFDVDSVCLLKPSGIDLAEWTKVMDYVKSSYGKQYDNLFDITSDQQVSCVELIYWGLRQLPDYQQHFPKLIALIEQSKELTPQMLLDTGEFEVVFEVRR